VCGGLGLGLECLVSEQRERARSDQGLAGWLAGWRKRFWRVCVHSLHCTALHCTGPTGAGASAVWNSGTPCGLSISSSSIRRRNQYRICCTAKQQSGMRSFHSIQALRFVFQRLTVTPHTSHFSHLIKFSSHLSCISISRLLDPPKNPTSPYQAASLFRYA
jgi:hypothetical protein